MAPAAQQTFLRHAQELRQRMVICMGWLVVGGGAAFMYRRPLIDFIAKPIHQPLFYTSPSGGFDFVLRICLAVGVVLALPATIYNLIRFVEPALAGGQGRRAGPIRIILASNVLAWTGLAFAYLFVLPSSFRFFAQFNTAAVRSLISTSEYLSFTLGCLTTFAVIFQLPLVLIAFNHIDRFPPCALTRFRRHVIIGSLAVALVLPFTYDPITQFIIAVPIIGLFELSVLTIWLLNRRHRASVPSVATTAMRAEQPGVAIVQAPPGLATRRPIQFG